MTFRPYESSEAHTPTQEGLTDPKRAVKHIPTQEVGLTDSKRAMKHTLRHRRRDSLTLREQ